MLTENQIKERLSHAYIHAVAARNGFECHTPPVDDGSVDVIVSVNGRLENDVTLHHVVFQFQLKATATDIGEGDTFAYDLPIKNYNELRARSQASRLLMVYAMPQNEENWLEVTADRLISRHCGYWWNPSGAPETENSTTKTVYVRRRNMLTPETLRAMAVRLQRGEEIGDAL